MRFRALGVLAALSLACASAPYEPFDAGHEVHVLVAARPRPDRPIRLRPVCTVGDVVHKSGDQPFAPDGPAVREVAVLHAPAGRHRFSIWLPHLRIGERATLRIERDLWVVVEIGPKRSKGLRVYDEPPHGALGDWAPLVAVPR